MFCAPSGDIYVSDGYRNARVHRFSAGGELISSWGVPGKGAPGEFYLPHSLWVDSAGLVYVCDRKNQRVQIFSSEGECVSQWTGLTEPVDICMDGEENVFVHEGGTDDESPRITVLDRSGNVQARFDTVYGASDLGGRARGHLHGGLLGAAGSEVRAAGVGGWVPTCGDFLQKPVDQPYPNHPHLNLPPSRGPLHNFTKSAIAG